MLPMTDILKPKQQDRFTGRIREVRLHHRALTDREVETLQQSQRA